jgi:hypothetical protein
MKILPLARRAKQLWPTSRHNRRQWLMQTVELYRSGRHVLANGKVSWR